MKSSKLAPGTAEEGTFRPLRACRVVTTSLTARILLANQLRSLQQIDWTVVTGDLWNDPIEGTGVKVVPMCREFAWSDPWSFVRLLRYLKSQKFDVVQTHTPKASFLGLPAARLAGSTAVYSIHGARYFAEYGRRSNVLGWLFERWCCTWANTVLVQSHEDETVLPRAHICAHRKVRYVGNGIAIDRFLVPVEQALDAARPVVLMVSRLVREKGVDDFIDLAARLAGKADFVHVGWFDHDRRDALSEQDVASASATGAVRFLGGVDDVRPYLASATLVVLPSYREGISRVSMEAATMGRPVVAYDVRGVREVIDPHLGLLAPCGDLDALSEIVSDLIQDPKRCDELGKCCRKRVVERFSEDLVIERLRCLYAEAAKNAGLDEVHTF